MTSKKGYTDSSCKHFTGACNSTGLVSGRDAHSPDRVARDRLGYESRCLHVPGELAQVLRARGASLRRADGLLHDGEAPVEHARAGERLGVSHEARLEAREHFELVFNENVVGRLDPLDAH